MRTSTTQADNLNADGSAPEDGGAKTWSEIQITYDQAGQMEERQTEFDNGIVKYEMFQNGVRTSTIQADNLNADGSALADGGAKNWSEIQTLFDENGQTTSKDVIYDDGRTAQTFYENGARSSVVTEDNADVFVWNSKITEYDDNGKVATKFTEYDNADEMALFYLDQELQARVDVDGNDSNAWAAKLTDYRSGEAVVTTYDSFAQLPDPYAGLFGDLSGGV